MRANVYNEIVYITPKVCRKFCLSFLLQIYLFLLSIFNVKEKKIREEKEKYFDLENEIERSERAGEERGWSETIGKYFLYNNQGKSSYCTPPTKACTTLHVQFPP